MTRSQLPEVLDGLGNSSRLVGIISTYLSTCPIIWYGYMALCGPSCSSTVSTDPIWLKISERICLNKNNVLDVVCVYFVVLMFSYVFLGWSLICS